MKTKARRDRVRARWYALGSEENKRCPPCSEVAVGPTEATAARQSRGRQRRAPGRTYGMRSHVRECRFADMRRPGASLDVDHRASRPSRFSRRVGSAKRDRQLGQQALYAYSTAGFSSPSSPTLPQCCYHASRGARVDADTCAVWGSAIGPSATRAAVKPLAGSGAALRE